MKLVFLDTADMLPLAAAEAEYNERVSDALVQNQAGMNIYGRSVYGFPSQTLDAMMYEYQRFIFPGDLDIVSDFEKAYWSYTAITKQPFFEAQDTDYLILG